MMQEIIVALIFLVAVAYFVRHFYNQTKSSGGCSSSCGCESFKTMKKLNPHKVKHEIAEINKKQ